MKDKSIIIGVGNPIASDDAVGVVVAQRLARRLPDFDVDAGCTGGFDLVDRIVGYRRAVIIDAMITNRFPLGTVTRVDLDRSNCLLFASSHGISVSQAIEFARQVGAEIPQEIIIYGVEIGNVQCFSEGISQGLGLSIDSIVEQIERDLLE